MKNRIEPVDNDGYHGVSYEWDSLEDYMCDLREMQSTRYSRWQSILTGHSHNARDWFGCAGGPMEYLSKLENGWPALHARLAKMMDGIELELPEFPSLTTQRRRKRSRADQGDAIDMHRVWSGQLDTAWEKPERVERAVINTKRVTLAYNVSVSMSVTNDEALWRAALAMLLCDSLVRAGRVLEVWSIHSSGSIFVRGPGALWRGWCVKPSHEPLNLDRLCTTATVGFARVCGFAAANCGPYVPRPSYGTPLTRGLPATLARRRDDEVVVRVDRCFDREDVIREYNRAWKEVEQHSKEVHHAA